MLTERRTQAARSRTARDAIVQAALTVFALKGYTAASMDDVCLAAGCSKGGLYHHFSTKAAVLSAVVERLAAANALMPPFAAIPGIAALTPPAIGRVLIEIWAEASRDDGLRKQLMAGYEARLASSMAGSGGIADLLRIGTLIQLLARNDQFDADDAARRLGIEHAA
jgi:AcrR family transcriptional regulator